CSVRSLSHSRVRRCFVHGHSIQRRSWRSFLSACMAALQVAINPLLRVSGGEEHFAFNAVLAQLIFGAASFVSPRLYSHFVAALSANSQTPRDAVSVWLATVVSPEMPWTSMYWIFT